MVLNSNSSTNGDWFSRIIRTCLRAGFNIGGKCAPSVALNMAAWLLTKPARSKIRAHETFWLEKANSFFVNHKQHQLAVLEWGSGPPILCVHGWSSRGLRFSSLIDPLVNAGFRVVVFDAPAHGHSTGSHIEIMGYADAIVDLVGKIGPVYGIIAHSFGAAAVLLALEKGLKVEKIIFFSALNGIRGPLNYMASTLQIPKEVLERMHLAFEHKFGRTIESLEAVQIVPQLKTPPLLIVHDIHDPVLPYHNALDLNRLWKNSTLFTTAGKGHIPILNDAQAIKESLLFLQDASSV